MRGSGAVKDNFFCRERMVGENSQKSFLNQPRSTTLKDEVGCSGKFLLSQTRYDKDLS